MRPRPITVTALFSVAICDPPSAAALWDAPTGRRRYEAGEALAYHSRRQKEWPPRSIPARGGGANMGGGPFLARAASAAALLAAAGCGSGTATTPTPAIFGTSLSNPASASGNPTGQLWTGTEHTVLTFLAGCSVTEDGTLSMAVSSGLISGTAHGSYVYLRTSCGGSSIVDAQTVPITGTASSSQFRLTVPFGFGGIQLPMTVPLTSAKSAHADTTDQQGSATRRYTVDLTCSHC
jgi:hypothetical protein